MGVISSVSRVFVTDLPDHQTKKAAFISNSGKAREVTYRTGVPNQADGLQIGDQTVVFAREALVGLWESLHLDRDSLSQLLRGATIVPLEEFDDDVRAASEEIRNVYRASPAKLAKRLRREGKIGVERRAQYLARTFHLISGVAITPIEMTIGLTRLAARCSQLAVLALGLLALKAAALSPRRFSVVEMGRRQQQVHGWIESAMRDVRVALLQLIPFVGAKLANIYRMSDSWSDFLDAPALGGVLKAFGISPSNVFFLSSRPAPNPREESEASSYLNLPHPTIQQTRDHLVEEIRKSLPGTLSKHELTIRIPVATEGGNTRYHDGTMLFGSENPAAKTVVLYHGAGGFREKVLHWAEDYLSRGYNVLVASYAGDPVVVGATTGHHYAETTYSELALLEDARADAEFLHQLGVTEVAVEGYSLGGAQAMNFAQAIAVHHPDMAMDFVALSQTFTNIPAVCQNTAKNTTKSAFFGRLARDFARRSLLSSFEHRKLGCDGLDNVKKLRQVVASANFSKTKYYFLGTEDDFLMGDYQPGRSGKNFIRELHRTVKAALRDQNRTKEEIASRVMKEIKLGFHRGETHMPSMLKVRDSFLFGPAAEK